MKHLGLFEGIGGFSLAARWMGWETIAWVEIDKFCQKVLKKNFPNAKGYGDIKEFDGSAYRGTVDILTGGFPCQPFSQAGAGKGIEDHRFLWPQMFRVTKLIRPGWIVIENVPGIKRLVIDMVCSSLESEGYETQPVIIPASALGAWHRRERVWIIANTGVKGLEGTSGQKLSRQFGSASYWKTNWTEVVSEFCRDNDGVPFELYIIRRIENDKSSNQKIQSETNFAVWKAMRTMWEHRELAETSPELFINKVCDSLSVMPRESGPIGWLQESEEAKELRSMWESFYSKSYEEAQNLQPTMLEYYRKIECRKKVEKRDRVNRIKSLGNAIVPQVAYEIFKAIESVTLQN